MTCKQACAVPSSMLAEAVELCLKMLLIACAASITCWAGECKVEAICCDNEARVFIDVSVVQMGTLGAGNHYVEIQVVEEVYDAAAAKAMGLDKASYLPSLTPSLITAVHDDRGAFSFADFWMLSKVLSFTPQMTVHRFMVVAA